MIYQSAKQFHSKTYGTAYQSPLKPTADFLQKSTRFQKLTVLPRKNAAPAPSVAPIESAKNPTGSPKR